MRRILGVLPAVAAISVAFAGGAYAQDLTLGSKAPALKVASWVKGKPVTNLADGKTIHVVEFWATWCGPCKVSIPHLTELAKKFKGKVDFTGVSVWERDDTYKTKVASFVKDMGAKMDYNIALDDNFGQKGTMARTWMEAAGQDGIPTAFIVGKDGKVLWIGHPMAMEEPLSQIVAGKYDLAAEKRKMDAQQKTDAAMQEIGKLVQSGKMSEALAKLDSIIAADPANAGGLMMVKYQLQLQTDPAAAYETAEKLANGPAKGDAMMLNQIAWPMVDDEAHLSKFNYPLAVKIAQMAVDASGGKDPNILDTLGYALFKNGQVDEAITVETKAVSLLPANADPSTKAEIEGRLKMFKAKKA